MSTKEPNYDVSPDFGNLVEKHKQLPFKRFMDLIESKLNDLNDMLLKPTPYDQGPGRQIPYIMPAWFGPLPLTTARRATEATDASAAGFELNATLADPSFYYTPRNGDILVNRDQSVRIKSLAAFGFISLGYTASVSSVISSVPAGVINSEGVGDIFDAIGADPAVGPNGGAQPMDFFGGTFSTLNDSQPNLPNIAFDVELYDKLRGRRMHDDKLPLSMFLGGRHGHRRTASDIVWPQGSKIEPRIFVNEIRMGSTLDTDIAYDAASFKAWVCLLFKGVSNLEVPNV